MSSEISCVYMYDQIQAHIILDEPDPSLSRADEVKENQEEKREKDLV